jgi:hypothetical protein
MKPGARTATNMVLVVPPDARVLARDPPRIRLAGMIMQKRGTDRCGSVSIFPRGGKTHRSPRALLDD